MPDLSILLIFIPTFFIISLSPGLCMSLAMTLGMTIGVKRTLWMMLGEVTGISLVAICSVFGIASLVLHYPNGFIAFKWLAGIYLVYLGVMMWKTPVSIGKQSTRLEHTRLKLISKGFITAVANPKGWAFMISLLPPFIDTTKPLALQLLVLLTIIIFSEIICMLLYASGGKGLARLLEKSDNAQWINRIGGLLLAGVGIWLALS